MTLNIGLIGCGTIGSEIARAISDGQIDARLVAVLDRNPPRVEDVTDLVQTEVEARTEATAVARNADLVVEAAGQEAVEMAPEILATGTDVMLMSVGALSDDDLRSAVFEASSDTAQLHVPSGAIAGLDAIKAANSTGGLESVELTTRKPPAGLEGAPHVVEHDIDLGAVEGEETIFEGTARSAAQAFPSNINVAMALSLAGIGPDQTTVKIVADESLETNVHETTARGDAGRIETRVQSVKSPRNPKTSYLASLSAIALLDELASDRSIGT
jgi:aspartate dehydrogenase